MNEFIHNNIITVWIVFFVFEIIMGILAQSIAEKKGHSKHWFWAGFLLSLVGVVWAAGLPDEHLRRQLQRLNERDAAVPAPSCAPFGGGRAEQDELELAVVISAAVAAMGEAEGKGFVLRSFRPAGEGSTAWNRAGRLQTKRTYR
jgi:hypothetical protein